MNTEAQLTQRETEIAEYLAWGAAKKEVADQFNISIRTVENTARNIFSKLHIQKATELCVWWFCTKHGVSLNLSPIKRQIIAIVFIILVTPQVFTLSDDPIMCRTGTARTMRTGRIQRRKGDELLTSPWA